MSCSIAELEERFDHEEIERWRIFDIIEPIGDERLDVLAAYICSVVRSSAGGKVNSTADYIPPWGSWIDTMPMSPEEESAKITAEFLAMCANSKIPVIQVPNV